MLLRTLPALHKFPALGTVALPQPHILNHRFARHLHGSSHHRDPSEGSAYKVAVPCSKTPLAKSAIAYSQSSQRSSRIYLQSAIMTVDFTSIPIIDLAEANNPVTKSQVLEQLRHVLLNVGFLYISNHGVPEQSIQDLVNALPNLFNLTEKEKDEVALHNSPHFLGYSGTGTETTAGKADSREQFEFATELEDDWIEGKPLAERLKGPNQWPSAYPSLRPTVEAYIASLTHLSERFLALVAEALSLPSQTFAPFLSDQHRLKLVHYPESEEAGQGVGPHKDSSGWWTFLLQASPPHVKGLQVLNRRGDWIDVPNVPGTFVVNIGQGFEVVTNGVCKATTHRVISGPEERFSVPFFQGLRRSLTKEEATGQLKEHFGRAEFGGTDESEEGRRIDSAFLRGRYDTWGESQLRTKIRSHPDVGRKRYGDISDEYFHEK